MALTFRTGSDGIGRALTIDELDNNFRHFTGSHTISGSLTISGSNGVGIRISGSIIPNGAGTFNLGDADNYFEELFVGNQSIIFVSGSTTSSFGVDSSGSLSGSFDGGFTGSFTGSGEITGSFTGSGEGDFTGSFDGNLTGSFTGSGEGNFTGSFTGSVDTQYNSGSCLIGCTSSAIPTGARPEGTFEFVADGGNYFMYVYLGGAWRSGSLA